MQFLQYIYIVIILLLQLNDTHIYALARFNFSKIIFNYKVCSSIPSCSNIHNPPPSQTYFLYAFCNQSILFDYFYLVVLSSSLIPLYIYFFNIFIFPSVYNLVFDLTHFYYIYLFVCSPYLVLQKGNFHFIVDFPISYLISQILSFCIFLFSRLFSCKIFRLYCTHIFYTIRLMLLHQRGQKN